MTEKQRWNRVVRRTAFLTMGLAAALVFGVIVLATGDWIPGTVIAVASLAGLAREVPVIHRFCSSPVPPRSSTRTS